MFAAMVDLLRSSHFQVYNLIFPSFNAVLPLHPFTGLLVQAANKLDKSNFTTAAIKTADMLLYKIHLPEVDAWITMSELSGLSQLHRRQTTRI